MIVTGVCGLFRKYCSIIFGMTVYEIYYLKSLEFNSINFKVFTLHILYKFVYHVEKLQNIQF